MIAMLKRMLFAYSAITVVMTCSAHAAPVDDNPCEALKQNLHNRCDYYLYTIPFPKPGQGFLAGLANGFGIPVPYQCDEQQLKLYIVGEAIAGRMLNLDEVKQMCEDLAWCYWQADIVGADCSQKPERYFPPRLA